MWKKVLKTDSAITGTILRLTLFVMLFPMGYLKLTDFSNVMEILQSAYGLPGFIALLVILIEFFVPLFLLAGLGTRLGGALIAVIMFGAIFYHTQHGYFMNWYGTQEGEGYQFHLLAIGAALALVTTGGGRWSTDLALLLKTQT